jgi:hypothetical protein
MCEVMSVSETQRDADREMQIDPAALLTDMAGAARERPRRDEIERYLDLEERVVFDWYDRLVPTGDGSTEARLRHRRILNALDDHDRTDDRAEDALHDIVDEHATAAERDLWAPLLAELDEAGSDELGRALQEARLSREEADVRLTPEEEGRTASEAEAASPGAHLVGLRDDAPEPTEPA